MPGVVQSPTGVVTADCEHCGTVCERSLEAGDGLTADQNREIADAVAWHHAHKCDERPDGAGPVAVELSVRGGST